MPRIREKFLSSSIKKCYGMITEVSHHSYKIEDNKKLIVHHGIFINQLQDNNERIIKLNQKFSCQDAGLYTFESNYRLPNHKFIQNSFCLNISTQSIKRYLKDSCNGILPEVTNSIHTETYIIQYPTQLSDYWFFPYFTRQDCFPVHRVSQHLEYLSYFYSSSSTLKTNVYPFLQDVYGGFQFANDIPFIAYLEVNTGILKFQADFLCCHDLVGTQIVIKLKNHFDDAPLPYPYDYTTVTINVESSPQLINDITVYLNQPRTQSLITDLGNVVRRIFMIPRVQGGPDAKSFVQINLSPPISLEINPQFGNQTNTYDQLIMVDYQDGTNDQIHIIIQVKVSYPHLLSQPSFLQTLNFGRSYNFTDLPNIVYSDSATNPSFTINVYDINNTEITSFNPLTYTSVGNLMTFNCFKSNGIIVANSSYNFTIKLSEDSGSAIYWPYSFQVTLEPPVFVEELKEILIFLKQQIAVVQLPDVYPADTSISVTQGSGAPIPSNIMKFDPVSRKMTYFFDQSTAGTVQTFIINFELKTSTGNLKTYTQNITFNDISRGVWFETPPPNITTMVGEIKNYQFPKLIQNGGTSYYYTLYPSTIHFLQFNALLSSLMIYPTVNDTGIYPFRIGISNDEGTPDLFYNFTVTVLNYPPLELPLQLQVNKGPPFFVGLDQLADITMQIGKTVKKQLPKIDDPDSIDTWKISIENFLQSGLYQFTTLSYPSLTFSPWDSSQAGFYIVTLLLKDSRHKLSRYSFNVIITDSLFMDSENNITTVEKDLVVQYDTTEMIQDTDSNLFSNENNANFRAKKKVYLPRRVIAEQAKLSQELRARISSINSVGELTVQFNRDVKIPIYYNSFNQSILEITLINKTKTKLRELQEIQSIEVSNQEKKLQFNWGIKSFSSRKITFKIDFQDPLEISQEQPNYLQVKFIQNGYFIDKFTGKSISLNYSTTEKVPKQMIPQSSAANYLSKNAETIKLTLSITLQANFVINILLSASLQFLWGMINTLQLIVRLPLFNLKFPANSQILFSILLETTNFQFFNYQPLQEAIFTFSETQPINQQFEDMGYQSVNAIENLGMVFYTLVFILIVYAMIFLIRIILRLMNAKAELIISKIENWVSKKLLYNTLIRFFIESYIEILVSCMVQFNQFVNKTSGDRFAAFIGVFFALLCIIMPFILIFLIRKYHSIIQTKDPKLDSINTIFENLSTSSPATLYYTAFFMLRRLLFALTIIFMNYIPMLQIFTLFVSSLATIIYLLQFKPFETPLLNRLEIFNEFCLYLMSYPCLLFTEVSMEDATGTLSSSTHFKYNMGWIVVGGVLLNIGVNMLIMIVMTIRMAWRGISQRLKCMKKKGPNEIQENSQSNQSLSISIEQKGDLTVQEYETALDENKDLAWQQLVNNQEIDEEVKGHVQFTVNIVRFSKVQPFAPEKIIEENSDQIQDYSKCQDNSETFIDNQIPQEQSREIIDKQYFKEQKGLNKKKIKVAAQIVSRKNEDFYPQALQVANLQAKVVKIAPNNQKQKKIK